MGDSLSRFWNKYLSNTKVYEVLERARQWVVRRVEAFVHAMPGQAGVAFRG